MLSFSYKFLIRFIPHRKFLFNMGIKYPTLFKTGKEIDIVELVIVYKTDLNW